MEYTLYQSGVWNILHILWITSLGTPVESYNSIIVLVENQPLSTENDCRGEKIAKTTLTSDKIAGLESLTTHADL